MTSCVLYHGDCLEVMPTLEHKSVDMTFADLPYGLLLTKKWDKQLPLPLFWNKTKQLCTDDALCVLTATMTFAHMLILSNPKDFRYDLVWEKKFTSNPFAAKRRPLPTHEHILIFGDGKTYNAQMRDESLRTVIDSNSWQSKKKSNKFFGTKLNSTSKRTGPLHPRSVIRDFCVERTQNTHPTQKPVALLEWLIATYTNPGDTVLDPVSGSNTTGVACARLGRNYIGIEKDAEYFKIGTERVNKERLALGLEPAKVVA